MRNRAAWKYTVGIWKQTSPVKKRGKLTSLEPSRGKIRGCTTYQLQKKPPPHKKTQLTAKEN